jgi:hypothetical protein
VPDDDEIIEAHEAEFAAEPPRRSNRGFWLVTLTLLVACLVLVVEIFVNRGVKDTIAHAQYSLRTAETAALALADRGTLAEADAGTLQGMEPDLHFVGPATASDDLETLSVSASPEVWAAAVQVPPGACFYLRIEDGTTTYGNGTVCTAEQALVSSTDTRW